MGEEETENRENKVEATAIDTLDSIIGKIDNEDFTSAVDSYRKTIEEELFQYFEKSGHEPEESFDSKLYSASGVLHKLIDPDCVLPHEIDSPHLLSMVVFWGKYGLIPSDLSVELNSSENSAKQLKEYVEALDQILWESIQTNEQLPPLTDKAREAFDELLPLYRKTFREIGIPMNPRAEVSMRALLSLQIRSLLEGE